MGRILKSITIAVFIEGCYIGGNEKDCLYTKCGHNYEECLISGRFLLSDEAGYLQINEQALIIAFCTKVFDQCKEECKRENIW